MEESKETTDVVEKKEKGFDSIILGFFRSIKLTIFLLILLAILSILGTVITQNASRADYIQRYGESLYEVLNFFNLFDMYHSLWFSAILVLLVVNLVACSLQRLPAAWSQVFRGSGSTGSEERTLKALPYSEKIKIPSSGLAKAEENIRASIKKWFPNPERIETEAAITLFSEKGRYSRLGVYITHVSILIILIGGLIGSLFGYRGFVNILEGETTDRIFLRTKDEPTPKPLGFSVRCDDFNISHYDVKGPRKLVKEYSSLLTVLEDGKEVMKKRIIVNDPLHYKGVSLYQSSYGAIHDLTIGVQFKGKKEKELLKLSEGDAVPIPNTPDFIRVLTYEHQVHTFGEGAQIALFKPNQQPRVFWLLRSAPDLDQQRGDNFVLSIEEVIEKEYTGLQVTKDPGVWVVWIGCALMIFGLIVSFFFSHQKLWIRIPKMRDGEIIIAGLVNRNRIGFEKTFGEILDQARKKGS